MPNPSRFTVEINTENDTFEGIGMFSEIVSILRHVTQEVDVGRTSGSVKDSNGNTVGRFHLK